MSFMTQEVDLTTEISLLVQGDKELPVVRTFAFTWVS